MKITALQFNYSELEIKEIQQGIAEVLQSGHLTMWKKVAEFEKLFADFIGVKYALAPNSGTSSLDIILRIIGVAGKTVIMPTNTMMATPTAVISAGGKIIFADCEKETLQLSMRDLKKKIHIDTKVVMLVHIGGIISPEVYEIQAFCKENGLILVEDAAHAHGSTIDDKFAGTLGLAGAFSFYPTKVLTTGEGGMITTNSKELYEKALCLRDYARDKKDPNKQVDLAYNWRMSELHAVLGIQQMRHVKEIIGGRRRVAKWYDEKLEGIKGIRKLVMPVNVQSSYYKYIVFLDEQINKEKLKKQLQEKYDITLPSEVYPTPCHNQPVFKLYPEYITNDPHNIFPNTDYIAKHHICLPIYPSLNEGEVDYVVDSLKRVLK